MTVLFLNGVNKHCDTKHTLTDFDYEIEDGVYVLLDPNGAGKSTMMNSITRKLRWQNPLERL